MSAVTHQEAVDRFERSLTGACRALDAASARAQLMGYDGAVEDLNSCYELVLTMLKESTSCTPGARRRLRQVDVE